MNRMSVVTPGRLLTTSLAALAFVCTVSARPAMAQTPAAAGAPAQEDPLKFTAATPALILFQIHAEKAADFESAWATLRAGAAKATEADIKALGESLGNLFKVDQPPLDTPGGKAVLYVLRLDSPSTTQTYNPYKILWEVLWKNGAEGGYVTRADADAAHAKFQAAFVNINPPWKLVKVG